MTSKEILIRLYKDYTSNYLNKLLIAGFFSILVAGSTSAVAYLLDPAIKKIFVDKDQTLLYLIPIAIILAFSTKGLSLYFAKVTMIHVAEDVKKNIQLDMMASLINADTKVIDSKHTGKIVSHVNHDTGLIVNLVSVVLLNLFKDTLTLFGLLFVMFYQNWKLSLIAIIMIPLASIAAKTLGKRMSKVTTQQMNRAGILTSYLMEIFKNHKLIKIFQQENYEKNRAFKFIDNLKESTKKIAIVFVRASPIMEFLTGIMIAFLIYFAAKLVASEELEVNNFFSFLAAMMLAYQPVKSLATINVGIGQGLSAARRLIPIIDTQNKILINENKKNLQLKEGSIYLNKVNFSYNSNKDNIVLNDINLEIKGGKMTALVGHSGSGKSTLLNLIPRIYDPVSGEILMDNQNIKNINLSSLRNEISIVDQNTTLFDDTVFNNIKYAKPSALEDEIFHAAEMSMSIEFINNLENKFKTIIGENGVKLSGGERQRLSIARAFLKNSKIILLDEATSSLDSETEEKIQKALGKLTSNKTTVVIAHRLSTILNSDTIYVLDKGFVIATGKHEDLLKSSIIYKNFYNKQIKNN